MAFRMSGKSGQLRCGYQVAAELGPWTMDDSGRVDASVGEVNSFYVDFGSPELWLRVGRKYWVWRTVTVIAWEPAVAVRTSGSPRVRDAE